MHSLLNALCAQLALCIVCSMHCQQPVYKQLSFSHVHSNPHNKMIAYCIFSVTFLYLAVSLTAAGQTCSSTSLANLCCKDTETCCNDGCCPYQSAKCCPNKKCCRSVFPVCCINHCCPITHGTCCGIGCCSNFYPVCCGSYCCASGTYCCNGNQCCSTGRRRSINELNSHPLLKVTIDNIQPLNTNVADTMVASKQDNEQAAVENEVIWSVGAEKEKKEFEDRHKITTRSVIVDLGDCFNFERLKLNEGYETCKYLDSKGIPTIGVGFNLQKSGARDKITAVGADYDKVLAGTECLNDDQIRQLLQDDADDAADCAKDFVPNYQQLHSGAKSAIADMAFNLGCAGLNGFICLKNALNRPDYQWAAKEMKDSLWCTQVGMRCQRDIDCMLS